jgi:hypothetical protein
VKLVHLVGFIINKFVMMHGHMNVKHNTFFFNKPIMCFVYKISPRAMCSITLRIFKNYYEMRESPPNQSGGRLRQIGPVGLRPALSWYQEIKDRLE